jgi:hypothetical protein
MMAKKHTHKLQGHLNFQGLELAIENKKGSVRSGVSKAGKKWRTVMKNDYGYVVSSEGADGDGVDVFVGDDPEAPNVYVVQQVDDEGAYDEDKLVLGVHSVAEAKALYLSNYDTAKYLGPIKEVPMARFKKLVTSGKKLTKISSVQLLSFFEELDMIQEAT